VALTGLAVIAIGLSFFTKGEPSRAAGNTLTLSPATVSVTKGQNVVLTMRVDTGSDTINAVEANLTYPTKLFDSVQVSSSSVFGIEAKTVAANGNIAIARGVSTEYNAGTASQGSFSGVGDVVTITLHAKQNGSGVIGFVGTGSVMRTSDNANISTGATGATVTVGSTKKGNPRKP
jgi:hypothetical protein